MTSKKYCDECGKEIKEFGTSFYGSKWKLYGVFSFSADGDFCSIKCLKKYLEKIK